MALSRLLIHVSHCALNMVRELLITCRKYGIEMHLKGGHTIKILSSKRSGVSYRFKCNRWGVIKNTLGSQLEPFGRDTKNIRSPLHQFMTILPSLVILCLLKISVYWQGKTKISSEQLKKPFTSGLTIHP